MYVEYDYTKAEKIVLSLIFPKLAAQPDWVHNMQQA